MTVAFNWNVVQMDCYPEVDNEQDVVFNVHWTLTGTEDLLTGSVYGSTGVTIDAEEPFTPYADLTLEQVVGWVQEALGEEQVAAYEANIQQQIDDQINPPVVTPPLPWAPVPEEPAV
jgi:hypothetical protein